MTDQLIFNGLNVPTDRSRKLSSAFDAQDAYCSLVGCDDDCASCIFSNDNLDDFIEWEQAESRYTLNGLNECVELIGIDL